jgi:hypothetical protein
VLQAAAQIVFFLRGHLGEELVLQLVVGDTLAAIELAEVAACASDAHQSFEEKEGVKGDGSGSEATIGIIEQLIGSELMMGVMTLPTLRRAGDIEEVGQFRSALG